MTTPGRFRAAWKLPCAALLAVSFATFAPADDGSDRPPRIETADPDRPSARDESVKRLEIVGVFDANDKPIADVELAVRIDESTAAKMTTARDGQLRRADLPASAGKVVIEADAPFEAAVGVPLGVEASTRLRLYLIDGALSAKLLPAPPGLLAGALPEAGGVAGGPSDCCFANGSPGCDDAECEAAVCACDPFCCDVSWDAFCAGEGVEPGCGAAILCAELCDGNGGGGNDPGADSCAEAVAIEGDGTYDFDTNGATTDGAAHGACLFFGNDQIFNDVWFCWTADCEEPSSVRVETCGGTGLDTKIAVYSACDVCPPGDDLLLACNDDDCGLQSGLSFDAVPGGSYLIRIGSFSAIGFGSGTFSISGCGGGGGGGGGTDDCADGPEAIEGEGTFEFDNTSATTDGIPDDLCFAFGSNQIEKDVWFCWTAPCDGDVRLETCGLTAVDTRVAVYDGCDCAAPILACNDDDCSLQSRVTWTATAGNQYLIRIGTFPGFAGGVGAFDIACVAPELICEQPPENCQDFAVDNANQSNTTGFTSADDFSLDVEASIGGVCWWGAYLPGVNEDEFVITYYADAGGIPGAVVGGPLTQGIDLTVAGPVDTGQLAAGITPIWEYTASHNSIDFAPGCYWIEIRNDSVPGTSWFWEWSFAGNGRRVVDVGPDGYDFGDIVVGNDFAFCLDVALGDPADCLPPPPGNDDCEGADAIDGEGMFPFDNGDATTDGPPNALCDAFGSDQVENDVWFCWTAPCSSQVLFETCDLTAVDTKIAVYDGCGPCDDLGDPLACNDDTCGVQSQVLFDAVAGQQYLLRIGTFPGAAGGAGAFSMTCFGEPENDDCADAIALEIPSLTPGTTDFASPDDAPFCGTSVTAPGVWYTVTGTGTTITASFCPGGEADYDTKLHVFCGACEDLICVGGNDDACGLSSEISWCSQAGATYYVLVSGFGSSTGDFVLNLYEDGVECTADVGCVIIGACCIDGVCIDGVTADDCVAEGGEYQGDGTMCAGGFVGYSIEECANPFVDISDVGNPGPSGDDSGLVVPLGFSFTFFGNTYTEIGISTNGYLTFGDDPTDFSNDPIPSPFDPNDLIAPYWDDFNTNDGGQIYYQTFDSPTRFMCQWTNVAEFGTGGASSATFQAILFANGTIEYRYGDLNCCGGPGDVTVGIENIGGTDGYSVDHLTIGAGDCIRIAPVFEDPIECPFEDCDENGIPDEDEVLPQYDPLEAQESDGPAGASYIGTDIYYVGNTIWAGNDANLFCGLMYAGYHDVYYCYRPATSGQAAFKVCNFSFDLVEPPNGVVEFSFGLAGTEETPPVYSTGTGRGCVTLHTGSLLLEWDIEYFGLSGTPVGAHFHQAPERVNGPVVVPLTDDIYDDGYGNGSIVGSGYITPEMAEHLLAGSWYLNVHTAMHPAGEVRGQVYAVECQNDNRAFLSVHDGPVATEGNQIACNFMSPVGQNCGAIAYVQAGHTYLIRIAGEGDTRGWFSLEVKGPRELLNPNDINENGELDVCECLPDVNGDGYVDGYDFNQVHYLLGTACVGCPEDINYDGVVDEQDLALVNGSLGPCPFQDDEDQVDPPASAPAKPETPGMTRPGG